MIERFEPGTGGAESVAWTVAHGLARAGDEVHVVARRVASSTALSLHTVAVPTAWQPLRVLAFSRAAGEAARALGCDVVHSFSRTRHQDVYRAGGGSHADYLRRSHGPLGRGLRLASPRHRVLLGIERRVFDDPAQLVQCNSAMVRDEIAARYDVPAPRLRVIHNGVDLERFSPERRASEGGRLRADLGARGRPTFVLVGSGLRRKGAETAIRALAAAQSREAELWIAGRDRPEPWRELAARLDVGSRVRMLGARGDVEAVYAGADALLLPTRYDAFANATLEAAASGLPVVTSGANGAADVLARGAVIVDDPDDVAGFAAAIDRLENAAERERLGRAARDVAEGLSWDAHVEALRALYREVAT